MQLAPTPLLSAPSGDPRISWSSWRLLSPRLWAPLLAALLLTLALALLGGEALEGPWTRLVLLCLAGLALLLLAALARLLLVQAERDRRSAEGQARELEHRVESRTRELTTLVTRQQEVTEREKAELSRKLHDELGGLLTAAKMDLSWLQARITDGSLRARLGQLGGVLDEATELKRRVVEDLRPSLLDHFGLATALSAHLDAACAQAGLTCELALPHDCALPHGTAITLFRIIQEGLTNTIRHAGARRVRLRLVLDPAGCELELADDGCGFDPAAVHGSHGIMSMQHRARSLDGVLTLSSSPGSGTTLRVKVPLPR
jgi:signal transduction histidine kinase